MELDIQRQSSLQKGYKVYGGARRTDRMESLKEYGVIPISLDVNVFGLARMMQLVLPYMRKKKSGKIINISSVGGRLVSYLGGWYHASKWCTRRCGKTGTENHTCEKN